MAIEPADPLHDAALALIGAGLDADVVQRELAAVRHRWSGQTYIRARDPASEAEIERRLAAGEHPREIARQVGVHRTTIVRRRSRWL